MISLSDVGKRFGSRIIVRNITLSVRSGEIALLTGVNGAGKSTILKMMAGLLRADKGSVQRHCSNEAVAYLGHSTFLYGNLTALENLSFWEGLYGGDTSPKRLLGVLKHVGLDSFAHERAGAFSRGMAQRLNLARVLLREPKLLLLDEPSTGLDSASTALMKNEIGAAQKRGASIVWITHTPQEDSSIADTVFEISNKTLAFAGTPREWKEYRKTEEAVLC